MLMDLSAIPSGMTVAVVCSDHLQKTYIFGHNTCNTLCFWRDLWHIEKKYCISGSIQRMGIATDTQNPAERSFLYTVGDLTLPCRLTLPVSCDISDSANVLVGKIGNLFKHPLVLTQITIKISAALSSFQNLSIKSLSCPGMADSHRK